MSVKPLFFQFYYDISNKNTTFAYVETLNPGKKLHRAEKFADHMSIYDVIVPCALSRNNQVISYLDRELAEKCYDFDMMPDSLVKALDEGNRLLVIYNIH